MTICSAGAVSPLAAMSCLLCGGSYKRADRQRRDLGSASPPQSCARRRASFCCARGGRGAVAWWRPWWRRGAGVAPASMLRHGGRLVLDSCGVCARPRVACGARDTVLCACVACDSPCGTRAHGVVSCWPSRDPVVVRPWAAVLCGGLCVSRAAC